MFILNRNPKVQAFFFADNGAVPNSCLPVLLYNDVFSEDEGGISLVKKHIERHTLRNGWRVDWVDVNAVYRYTHYHSTAHEILAVIDEVAELRLGGSNGKELKVGPGDLIAIPAGVAHRRISGNKYFQVAGLYPFGQQWDMLRQTRTDYKVANQNLSKVSLPAADPFYGKDGPLMKYWR